MVHVDGRSAFGYGPAALAANRQVADVTGPADATRGILFIYDIFGYFEQSLQGADILATSDKHHQYKVFIPDWFEGKPANIEW